MESFSFDVQVPPGLKPILTMSWGCESHKPSMNFPLGGTVMQIFVQPPGQL
jgi:hypothetical protein